MGYPAFWPITLLQSVVVLFRCKDNIAPKYCRYCGPSTGRREYSNTGDLFCGPSDNSEEDRV